LENELESETNNQLNIENNQTNSNAPDISNEKEDYNEESNDLINDLKKQQSNVESEQIYQKKELTKRKPKPQNKFGGNLIPEESGDEEDVRVFSFYF
jgi:hypothetical protein